MRFLTIRAAWIPTSLLLALCIALLSGSGGGGGSPCPSYSYTSPLHGFLRTGNSYDNVTWDWQHVFDMYITARSCQESTSQVYMYSVEIREHSVGGTTPLDCTASYHLWNESGYDMLANRSGGFPHIGGGWAGNVIYWGRFWSKSTGVDLRNDVSADFRWADTDWQGYPYAQGGSSCVNFEDTPNSIDHAFAGLRLIIPPGIIGGWYTLGENSGFWHPLYSPHIVLNP